MHARRAFRQTQDQRDDERTTVPVWWPVPTENTLDRATTALPGLLHARMEEIGLDFSIVYPGQGLLVITLPGMHDEELRRTAARAFNLYNATMFGPYADRLTPPRSSRCTRPTRPSRSSSTRSACSASRPRCSPAMCCAPCRRWPRDHPELGRYALYQDCFGIDSPYDYDPVWAKCIELGVAPTFHSGPHRLGEPCVGQPAPVQPDRRVRRRRRGARQVALLRRRHAALPDVAVRLPRRWRHLGPEPVLPDARALGEAQRRGHHAPRPGPTRHRPVRLADRRLRTPEGAGDRAIAS